MCQRTQEVLLEDCSRALEALPGPDHHMRLLAIRAVLLGYRVADVAQICNVSAAIASLWVKTLDEHGPEALVTKPKPGRTKKLTQEQMEVLTVMLQRPAGETEAAYPVWNSVTLADFLQKRFGVAMSQRNCLRILRDLGISKQSKQGEKRSD